MKSVGLLSCLLCLCLSCSHQGQRVSQSLLMGSGALYKSSDYEDRLGILRFNNAKDHSLHAYPVTLSYVFAFNEFLDENPAIATFLNQKAHSTCFYLKIEARDRGASEADISRWKVQFLTNKEKTDLTFIKIPLVSPRPSVKNRVSQRGRETWWINESYVCSETPMDWSQDFQLLVTKGEDEYKMSWKIEK